MEAYENIGRVYSHIKNYENAIKCFKKQLELSWRTNDVAEELKAYESLGMQYYYLGKLDRAKYYNDRCMRGKIEKKDSKIRALYDDYNRHKTRVGQERVTFKKLKEILDSFTHIHNEVLK